MVTLPEIADWSPQQIALARQRSPAVDRYLELLNKRPQDFSGHLRHERHQAWVRCSLATLFESHSAQEICFFWSGAATSLLKKAWTHHQLDTENLCLLAMGKLGAQELNLSSDIDIFFVSDSDVDKKLLKKVRLFLADLSEVQSLGFCFRVDLDLRPGGRTSPLILTFDQMTNHYGYHGETWERVAMIRQTIPLGPEALRHKITEFCRKFSFRKHIDYSLFHDLYSLREKIQAHKLSVSKENIKFCKGGIRDLELLVHSLQLIHGGKNSKLMTPSVTIAISELESANLLSSSDAKRLKDSYWFFRNLENKIQCENDQHTYEMGSCQLLLDHERQEFAKRSEQIAQIVDQLLRPFHSRPRPQEPLEETFQKLQFNDDVSLQLWRSLNSTKLQSRTRARDEEERQLFLQNVLKALEACRVDPPMALRHMQQFLSAIKAKTSFLSLLNQHFELIEELIWIFSCSPFLAQILIHRPELLDSFLLKNVVLESSDEDQFASSAQDFKLLSDLISSSQFLRHKKIEQLLENLTQTTDTLVLRLLELLQKKFGVKVSLMCLGKWGAKEMGLTSDLDFIFLSEQAPEDAHFKLARRFIHFLNSPHSGQKLYPIDLRLRPSGSAGPLFLTAKDLRDYLENSAEIWERQAYLCHRTLPEQHSSPLFSPRPLTPQDSETLLRIQEQLLTKKGPRLDLKKNEGGLLHTELTLQIAALDQQVFPGSPNVRGLCLCLTPYYGHAICDAIQKNYLELRTYQQILILIRQTPDSHFDRGSAEMGKVAALLETSPKVLLDRLEQLLEDQKSLLNKLDPLARGLKIEE